MKPDAVVKAAVGNFRILLTWEPVVPVLSKTPTLFTGNKD